MSIAWPHQAEMDYRQPLFVFRLPSVLLTVTGGNGDNDSYRYGFYNVSIMYWIELVVLVVTQMIVASLTACILYRLVVVRSKKAGNQSSSASFGLLVGWGIIIPFWVCWPFVLCQILDVRNVLFRFCIGVIVPTLSIFRTTECIYGFSPKYATKSLKEFVQYFASVLVFERTRKTSRDNLKKKDGDFSDRNGDDLVLVPCPPSQVIQHLMRFILFLFLTGALQSYLAMYPNSQPFGPLIPEDDRDAYYALSRYTTWHLYANSALQGMLFQMYLTAYCEGLTFAFTAVSGYMTSPVMKNPLLESKSPSDFWGRRWNLLVHRVLKNGVYKPVRKHFPNSPILATCAAFLASGLFHEWLLMAIYTPVASQRNADDGECISSCYQPTYGNAIVFFLWQAGLVALEMVLGKTPVFRWCDKNLPPMIKTFCIILLGIPLAHYFTEPYFRSNFFFDPQGSPGLPMIRPIMKVS